MKTINKIALVLCFTATALSVNAKSSTVLTTEDEKFSYVVGLNMATNFKNQGITLKSTAVSQGITDALTGAKPLVDAKEQQQIIADVQHKINQKREEENKMVSNENQTTQEKFMAENASKSGVKTTKSGLQYKIIKAGSGDTPKLTDTVTVNYEGRLLNGDIFDSSYKRGQPISFAVNQVIPGWTEALQMMKPGAEWELYIPAKLAYGDKGVPGVIPANSMLIFKVELISFKK
jgi:FKBP-type peptidyl-prolyl cis-trans isomerase FklB